MDHNFSETNMSMWTAQTLAEKKTSLLGDDRFLFVFFGFF